MAANMTTVPGHLIPISFQQITTVSASIGLTVPDKTVLAVIQPEAQNVRYRDDGVAPTAAIGMKLIANDFLFYTGDMAAIRFIEEAASAKLNITYYRNNG